ncbi:hypothetical protein [Armatimonas sp.]|uniref:hypothetical protein n=1 Tax=Armatimonas sp. TaxID=1872638 RepID=UPI00374DBA3D
MLCERREIRLHTEFRDVALDAPFEYTDVVFRGVFAYHFQQDTLTNIIFDIEEVAVTDILEESQALLAAGRPYGWPRIEGSPEPNLEAYLSANAVRGFKIASSYGLDGWVLAQSMEFIAAMPSA